MALRHHAAVWTAFLALANVDVARASSLDEDRALVGGCELSLPGRVETTSESCVACHRVGSGSNHPFDVDYATAIAMHPYSGLRSPEEVVKRGVFLVEGKVSCRTCHDPRSPWENHIALPPGARPTPAVNPRDRQTYEDGPERTARIRELQHPQVGGERRKVSAKPLCLVCHALD
jgi:hypothetical protein